MDVYAGRVKDIIPIPHFKGDTGIKMILGSGRFVENPGGGAGETQPFAFHSQMQTHDTGQGSLSGAYSPLVAM